MFFSTLQRNNPYGVIIFPILLLGLWGSNIIAPHFITYYYDVHPMPLYKPLLTLQENNNYVGIGLLLSIISINILLITRINTALRLIEKRSSFYLVLFIILSAIFPEFKQLNPMQFALTFIILGVFSIFKIYKNEHSLRTVYEAGFCFSIASLFYANSFFFTIIIFIGLFTLVPFNWRQWMSGILGFVTPLVFTFSWAFLFNKLPYLINIIEQNTIVWHKTEPIELLRMSYIGFLFLLLIASLFFTFSGVIKKVAIQKYYFLLFLFLLAIIATYFSIPAASIEVFFFAILPLIFYIPNYLLSIKNRLISEIIFTIILVFIVLLQINAHLL